MDGLFHGKLDDLEGFPIIFGNTPIYPGYIFLQKVGTNQSIWFERKGAMFTELGGTFQIPGNP